MHRLYRLIALGFVVAGTSAATPPAIAADINVAVAANFTEPAKEIAALFESKTSNKVVFSFGASGQFYTQITQGAPFQVFLSADQERPEKAVSEGFAVPGSRFTYAVGKLVLWSRDANLVKGESYFFNEVKRIRNTIIQISDGRKWLVLMDELFKGTNVQDAMNCSSTVIKGLIKIKSSLFILSTHLYEIGEELKQFPNISFKYFF